MGWRMADWQTWRSREIVFVKPRTNSRGELEYVSKRGQVIPAETIKREYERIDSETRER